MSQSCSLQLSLMSALLFQFYLSSGDLDQFEAAQNEEEQKAILARVAANLPVLNRTAGGGRRSTHLSFLPTLPCVLDLLQH